jgi:Ca2+-dependent lipid-binding protein
MRNPFKELYKKRSIFAEFSEHLDEAKSDKSECYFIDALEDTFEAIKTFTGCKKLLTDFRRNLGLKGAHQRTPWWEKVLFIIYTMYAYLLGFFGLVSAVAFMILAFKIEFVVWLRERAKVNRRKKAVQYIMEKKKQGYDSPSWREE